MEPLFFLIIYYGVLNPIVNEKAKLADMNLKQEEIAKFNQEIKHIKKIKNLNQSLKIFLHCFILGQKKDFRNFK